MGCQRVSRARSYGARGARENLPDSNAWGAASLVDVVGFVIHRALTRDGEVRVILRRGGRRDPWPVMLHGVAQARVARGGHGRHELALGGGERVEWWRGCRLKGSTTVRGAWRQC